MAITALGKLKYGDHMLINEYCISIFTLGNSYIDTLRPEPVVGSQAPFEGESVPIAFGEGIDAFVRSSSTGWSMLRKLGLEVEGESYTRIDITGSVVTNLLDISEEDRLTGNGTALTRFESVLSYICSQSQNWAVFFWCDCDDYAVTLKLDVDEMVRTVERFFVEEPEELLAGFVIMRPS